MSDIDKQYADSQEQSDTSDDSMSSLIEEIYEELVCIIYRLFSTRIFEQQV